MIRGIRHGVDMRGEGVKRFFGLYFPIFVDGDLQNPLQMLNFGATSHLWHVFLLVEDFHALHIVFLALEFYNVAIWAEKLYPKGNMGNAMDMLAINEIGAQEDQPWVPQAKLTKMERTN